MPAGNPEAYAEMDLAEDPLMSAEDEPPPDEGGGLALDEGSEDDLDPIFGADAAELFPEFDDKQLAALQRLIDSRLSAGAPSPEAGPLSPEPADAGFAF